MKILKHCLVILILLLISCGGEQHDKLKSKEFSFEGQSENGFEEGKYCAKVDYYNPKTGTSNSYKLNVDVRDNKVVKIYFGNGGYLDSDHMTPKTLDENGKCKIYSDKNYEYSIEITGSECSFTDNVSSEIDGDTPIFTFLQCANTIGMSQKEIDFCLKNSYTEDQMLSEKDCNRLLDFIFEIRKEEARYQQELDEIRDKQNDLENEINNGYIQRMKSFTIAGNLCQMLIISKKKKNYLLLVRGNQECTMGTAIFNENNYDWQLVKIKEDPRILHYSGHYMKIVRSGGSISSLEGEMSLYCGF